MLFPSLFATILLDTISQSIKSIHVDRTITMRLNNINVSHSLFCTIWLCVWLHKFFFAPYRMYLCKTVSTVQHDACIYWLGMFTLLIHLMNNRYSLTFKQIIVCEENKV